MATKTITITNEAYEKLAAFKESKESFSDVINKIMGNFSLLELVGVISNKEAEDLSKSIKEIREKLRVNTNKTSFKLQ